MYLSFYGLNERPFNLTPDANFLYPSEIHREVLGHLLYGINNRMGFICVTGEVGAGKTTLCRVLLNQLDEKTEVAFVLNSYLTEFELLKTINEDLGISTSGRTRKELIDELNKFLVDKREHGGNVAVIIDEAQNLSIPVLEQLRMLSNIETEKEKLLQIILVGQPELSDVLLNEKIRQLNQRITVRHHITPLSRAEVKEYIYYRLKVAGSRGDIVFTDGAVDEIYRYSKGIPRAINVIGEQALLVGYVANSRRISRQMIRKAVKEVWGEKKDEIAGRKGYRFRGLVSRAAAGIAVVAALSVGSFYFLQAVKGNNNGQTTVKPEITSILPHETSLGVNDGQGISDTGSDPGNGNVVVTANTQDNGNSGAANDTGDEVKTSLVMTAMTSGAGMMLGKPVDAAEDPSVSLETGSPFVESDYRNPMKTGVWASELDATVDLMRLWKIEQSYVHAVEVQYENLEIDPAGVSRIADMGFVALKTDMKTLAEINLPAVVEMNNKDGSTGYAVLKSFSDDKAELIVESRLFRLSTEEAEGIMTGNVVMYCGDRFVNPQVLNGEMAASIEVRKLQDYLKQLGYFEANTDGWYAEETKAAVQKFQLDHGLEETGEATGYVKLLIYNEIYKENETIPRLQ